jgi:hypothetical protein
LQSKILEEQTSTSGEFSCTRSKTSYTSVEQSKGCFSVDSPAQNSTVKSPQEPPLRPVDQLYKPMADAILTSYQQIQTNSQLKLRAQPPIKSDSVENKCGKHNLGHGAKSQATATLAPNLDPTSTEDHYEDDFEEDD